MQPCAPLQRLQLQPWRIQVLSRRLALLLLSLAAPAAKRAPAAKKAATGSGAKPKPAKPKPARVSKNEKLDWDDDDDDDDDEPSAGGDDDSSDDDMPLAQRKAAKA